MTPRLTNSLPLFFPSPLMTFPHYVFLPLCFPSFLLVSLPLSGMDFRRGRITSNTTFSFKGLGVTDTPC